ncbi:hypothetical protein TREMEDRAFT_57593 [Tremella mesenterica DSM 1558]|uniref:uncharacterized protein n=1 Tax=Tremella mesenterica (strain ATCC 24925 / CBS 8224 / DSM 1558 / NBRC 9311 / NRRL Y-6157 / RJB 2259-6 / UBC 559-6) TaxID=578456 RepID=UPI0003F49CB5|nr:uncharacterized protein TREMEDRAFT_57593 [Tremella mesenterica DSM 1558]EIW67415.1 hypothetical protein TREMEDRAFT_57593 [Tremella mesenterica DSM 1558]
MTSLILVGYTHSRRNSLVSRKRRIVPVPSVVQEAMEPRSVRQVVRYRRGIKIVIIAKWLLGRLERQPGQRG